ncbi:chloride channel protein [Streptacidiphilus monticola]
MGHPLAALIGLLITAARALGFLTEGWVHGSRPALRIVMCAVAVGACITLYALATDRSPEEAALSGQATLGQIAADPHSWAVTALLALVAFKLLGWGVALGSLRGGPIFPAVMIGAALGVACGACPDSAWLRAWPPASRRRAPRSPDCPSPVSCSRRPCSARRPTR